VPEHCELRAGMSFATRRRGRWGEIMIADPSTQDADEPIASVSSRPTIAHRVILLANSYIPLNYGRPVEVAFHSAKSSGVGSSGPSAADGLCADRVAR